MKIESKERDLFRESFVAREKFINHLKSRIEELDKHDPDTEEFLRNLSQLKMQIQWIEMDIQRLKDEMFSREFWTGHKSTGD